MVHVLQFLLIRFLQLLQCARWVSFSNLFRGRPEDFRTNRSPLVKRPAVAEEGAWLVCSSRKHSPSQLNLTEVDVAECDVSKSNDELNDGGRSVSDGQLEPDDNSPANIDQKSIHETHSSSNPGSDYSPNHSPSCTPNFHHHSPLRGNQNDHPSSAFTDCQSRSLSTNKELNRERRSSLNDEESRPMSSKRRRQDDWNGHSDSNDAGQYEKEDDSKENNCDEQGDDIALDEHEPSTPTEETAAQNIANLQQTEKIDP